LKKFDIVVIGAGASGLMFATFNKDKDIAIIEGNSQIAQKIKISGGKRCNITNENVSEQNYLGDKKFVKSVLDSFSNIDLLEFLKKRGCEVVLRKDNQYFCKTSSQQIIDVFQNEIKDVPIFLNHKVTKVSKNGNFFIETTRGNFEAEKVVVASGGESYPKIGATSIAKEIAKSFSHKVTTTSPALVGFTLQKEQFWFKELSGVSMLVKMRVGEKEFCQDLLFTHRGISGPVILNSSVYWTKGDIEIDFLPYANLKKYLKNSKKLISTALPLPKRFMKMFLSKINLKDKTVDTLCEEEIEKLSLLKKYIFSPAGNFGYQKAEVTRGGICTDGICSKTMMSKYIPNLYFIGECLDVTGELGGYNFQWAFSSGVNLEIY